MNCFNKIIYFFQRFFNFKTVRVKLNKNINNFNFIKFNFYKKFKFQNIFLIKINEETLSTIFNFFKVKYKPSTNDSYLSNINLKELNILYLRKNKIFNKSRYSRNRQTYRTGAY